MTRWLIPVLFFLPCLMPAQIPLENPSFEGQPMDATIPPGWHACMRWTTPDILPGSWAVYKPPFDGDTYMGLITREDGTWESVGQQLKKPLIARECYSFSLHLAHSGTYAGYNLPLRLRIWGGTTACAKDELLAETGMIEHHDWRKYNLELIPSQEIRFIILEAYYGPGIYFHYKGNVLIDNCSVIIECKRAEVIPFTPVRFSKT